MASAILRRPSGDNLRFTGAFAAFLGSCGASAFYNLRTSTCQQISRLLQACYLIVDLNENLTNLHYSSICLRS